DAFHALRGLELLRQNAHGNTGTAGFAGGTIGDVLGTAEAALCQEVIEFGRLFPHEMREHLALELSRKIRAGRGGRQEKLRGVTRLLRHLAAFCSKLGGHPSMAASTQVQL